MITQVDKQLVSMSAIRAGYALLGIQNDPQLIITSKVDGKKYSNMYGANTRFSVMSIDKDE